ncbi:MAG: polysaccharide biosynthesis/export family protein [Planctomycetaceae bacterium]
MRNEIQHTRPLLQAMSGWTRSWLLGVLCLAGLSGCAAFTPIEGVPASHLPPEFLGQSRNHQTTISPMLLTRSRPQQYLVDRGDVLSIYIPGVLGTRTPDFQAIGESPPINIAYDPEIAPSVGYPIHVRDDGTVSLPQVQPIPVSGMTLRQVEEAIQRAYSHPKQILPQGNERILVSLFRPREIRVLVVRQEASTSGGPGGTQQPGTVNLGSIQRGTSRVVNLKAYENDVMHALSRVQGVDGLPGLDAENMIRVIRRRGSQAGPMPGDGFAQQFPTGMMPPSYQPPMMPQPMMSYPPGVNPVQQPMMSPPSGSPQPGYGQPMMQPGGPVLSPSGSEPTFRYQSPESRWNSMFQRGRSDNSSQASSGRMSGSPTLSGHSVSSSNPMTQGYRSTSPTTVAATSYGSTRPVQADVTRAGNPFASNRNSSGFSATGGHSISRQDVYTPGPNEAWRQNPSSPNLAQPLSYNQPSSTQFPAYSSPSLSPEAMGRPMTSPQTPAAWQRSPQAPVTTIPKSPGARLNQVQYLEPIQDQGFTPHSSSQWSTQPAWGTGETWALHEHDISGLNATIDGPDVIKIPIRLSAGESLNLSEADITLHDGDIVFIESRGSEVYYTGGLLGGGQYTLPRDYDLTVLDALSIAQSGGRSSGSSRSLGGVSALNQDVTVSASKVIVLRTLVDGSRLPIEVDLRRIKRNMTSRENILIQPGDHLILQYSKFEAIGAFLERHLLEGALFGVAAAQLTTN